MFSMTGYAFKEVSYEDAIISVEIKSVNSRFLDLTINLPPFLNSLESYFRQIITQKISRGKVDVFIRIKEINSNKEIIVDENLAKAYVEAYKKLSKICGITSNEAILRTLLTQDGVLQTNRITDVDNYNKLIEPILLEVLDDFTKDTKREGENLQKDLLEKLITLEECALFFKDWQPKMEQSFKEQIVNKFTELLEQNYDENRVMTEVASMLVKYTINEEVIRLLSHIKAMKDELKNNPNPGKKLDFICQEMNREINTIGSKNQFVEVGAMVIKAKDSLENIREQAKNVT